MTPLSRSDLLPALAARAKDKSPEALQEVRVTLSTLHNITKQHNNATHTLERPLKPRGDRRRGDYNRRLLSLSDDGRKFIFEDNHPTKTINCDSNNHQAADKSPEALQEVRVTLTNEKRAELNVCSFEVPHRARLSNFY